MRPGVPVACGPLPPEAQAEIAAVATRLEAPLVAAGTAVEMTITSDEDRITADVRTTRRSVPQVTLGLRGRHQADNAAVAVAILDLLDRQGHGVPDESVRAGLERPGWPGRLEHFRHGGRDVLLDAAHNPAGARALADYLQRRGWTGVTLVFGAMADKDVRGMLEPLLPLCARLVCVTPPSTRALSAAELATLAGQQAARPLRIEIAPDPVAALNAAVTCDQPVVVAGSIFLVGPLRDILR
jgi:dihydrofolate synthase / folylpolyglutamate synthase